MTRVSDDTTSRPAGVGLARGHAPSTPLAEPRGAPPPHAVEEARRAGISGRLGEVMLRPLSAGDGAARWVEVETGGERLVLMPERSAWWPKARTLIVADLHLGKSQALRASGAPIPSGVLDETLARLDMALSATGAERLLVLGDLLHAGVGLTDDLIARVGAWRRTFGGRVVVVPGNHDRALGRVASAWSLEVAEPVLGEGGLEFRHEPGESAGAFVWAGHIHPAVTIRGGGDRVKLACFVVGARVGLLPAFTRFAAGGGGNFEPGARLLGIAEGRVVDVGTWGV